MTDAEISRALALAVIAVIAGARVPRVKPGA
jgi:hypothetical protein